MIAGRIPEAEAAEQAHGAYVALQADPDLRMVLFPEDTLARFQDGEIVTREQCLADESRLRIEAISAGELSLLRWMMSR